MALFSGDFHHLAAPGSKPGASALNNQGQQLFWRFELRRPEKINTTGEGGV